MKHWFVLLLASVMVAKAHDPFEIASVVYIQSNRIEVSMEMDFTNGLKLARVAPARETSLESQFSAARPRLEQFAGGLFDITAGNTAVQPLRTNVELSIETHIRGRLEIALTDDRPLRFSVPGLRAATDAPYGVRLTVLDLVNRKVLGQTMLFAESPPAAFPGTVADQVPSAGPSPSKVKSDETRFASAAANKPLGGAKTDERKKPRLAMALIIVAAGIVVAVVWRRSRLRS